MWIVLQPYIFLSARYVILTKLPGQSGDFTSKGHINIDPVGNHTCHELGINPQS